MITKNKPLFRFLFLFFGLYIFPFPLNNIPLLAYLAQWYSKGVEALAVWVGNNIFMMETAAPPLSGSGDKHIDYVTVLMFFCIAVLGSLIWTLLERKQRNYKKINYWFWVWLRYYLAVILLSYGLIKVFPLQMPQPGLSRMITEYGSFSPMGVAWSFIGQSTGYSIFSGLAETIAGLLLFHRRTTLLGGLMAIGVMSNVVALNFFYDIPVKLFSTTLLLIAVLIVSPQIGKLFQLMFGSKKVKPYRIYDPLAAAKGKKAQVIGKWVIIVFFVLSQVYDNYESLYARGPLAPKPPLYGLYEIEEFKVDGDVRPPLLDDSLRWRYVIFEFPESMQVYTMKKEKKWMKVEVDTSEQKLQFNEYYDTLKKYDFKYEKADSFLIMQGKYYGRDIYFKAKRLTKEDFPLYKRSFNWVQEYPYNR